MNNGSPGPYRTSFVYSVLDSSKNTNTNLDYEDRGEDGGDKDKTYNDINKYNNSTNNEFDFCDSSVVPNNDH